MQGFFELGVVGTKEQLLELFRKSKENEVLYGLGLEEDTQVYGHGLRTVEMYGLERFLDRFRVVMKNTGNGNISGMEEAVAEISKAVPELEVVLLTRSMDYDLDGIWHVSYYPAGSRKETAGGAMLTPYDADEEGRLLLADWDDVDRLYDGSNDDVYEWVGEQAGYSLRFACCRRGDAYYIEENPEKQGLPKVEYLEKLFSWPGALKSEEELWAENERWNRVRAAEARAELERVPFDHVDSVQVSGKSFVLTGGFVHLENNREAIQELVKAKGGRCTRSVSGKTDYVVIGNQGGFGDKKLEDVETQRGKGKDIKIIREDDLFAALEK